MINRTRCAPRTLTLAIASSSLVLAIPLQAREPAVNPPAAPAAVNETPQAPSSRSSVVAIPVPLPFPGQLKSLPQAEPPAAGRSHPSRSHPAPRDRVGAANEAARVQPDRTGFINAIQLYPFTKGALYQVYARPGQVTDIALQPGERLVGAGPVASGDTVRWMIGDTVSGTGAAEQVHILVKPTRPDIATNLVINTDRRTYHLELRANPSVYMASVSWTYPEDELIALRRAHAEAERAAPIAAGMDLASLDFRYRIEGDKPADRKSVV